MTDFRLTHPSRPTLEFRQAQADRGRREAVSDIAAVLASDQKPLVHVTTRERERTITGRVTGPRRAQNDPSASEWRQALANYVDELEAHMDEFQGTGYTLEDDVRNTTTPVVYTGLQWTLQSGAPYEFTFEITLGVGESVLESRPIDTRDPVVDQLSGNVAAKVGGFDLPGMRQMQVTKSVNFDTSAVYNRSSAENNIHTATEGTKQEVTFRGIHTGTESQRASADSNLDSLIGQGETTLQTQFPGYELDGTVLSYNPELSADRAGNSHAYELGFIESDPL
jgi:hypothetical protein